MQRMADWLKGGKNRVIAGDINGVLPSSWTKPLAAVGRWSKQVKSGPHNARIDYVGVARRGPYKVTRTRLMAKGRSDHKAVMVIRQPALLR